MAQKLVSPSDIFPRVRDNLVLIDYPAPKLVTPIKIDYMQISPYNYATSATVTSTLSSVYTANLINNLIPNSGHLYLVVPTINAEVVETQLSAPGSTGAGGAVVISDNDTNLRITNVSGTGSATNVFGYESCRVRLKLPGTVSWWGLDQLSTPGSIDWLDSPVEFPNAMFMFAVTDATKTGTLTMQFEMPANNLSKTAGMTGNVRFYIAFIQFSLLNRFPGVYTPIPTSPPAQSMSYQFDPGARSTPPTIPATF
jgi:hypothetical protein